MTVKEKANAFQKPQAPGWDTSWSLLQPDAINSVSFSNWESGMFLEK